jgi:hypothetical protein
MNLIRSDYLKASIFAFIVMVITFQSIEQPLNLDIDISWQYAINYFTAHKIIFGHQVFFTYGPFGFLFQTLPIKSNLFIALVVHVLIRLLLIYNLFLVVAKNTQDKNLIYKIMSYCFLIFFAMINDYMNWFDLFFLTISYICLYNLNQKKLLLIAASFFSIMMLLIKPGFSVLCFSAAYFYLLLLVFLERKIKPIIIFTSSSVVSYFSLWLALSYSFTGSIDYLLSVPEFTVGNSLAMTTNPSNNWELLSLSFIFFILACATFIKRPFLHKDSLLAFAIFFLPTYAMLKYGFTREDGHQLILLNFLMLTCAFMIVIINDIKRLLLLFVSSTLCITLFYWALQSVNLPAWMYSTNVYGYNSLTSQISDFSSYQQTLRKKFDVKLSQEKLPPLMLAEIGNQSVDVYNYLQSIVPANHLNWDPRPVFQTYASFMPYFDNLDANFIQSDRKPQYLLWSPFNDIDNRYILSTEPMAMYQIFKWYKPIMTSSEIYLLKTQSKPQLSPEKFVATTKAKWGDWIQVPSSSDSILRVRLKSKLTVLGKIKTELYKLFDVTIDYRLADNTIVTYRLVYPTALDGIWVSPLLQNPCQILNLGQLPNHSKVIAIRFSHDKFDYFQHNITLDWYGVNYLGKASKGCQTV